MYDLGSALAPVAFVGLPATPLGKLLVAIVVLAVVVVVGRFILSVAWKLLLVAGAVVAALYVLSVVL